MRSGGAEALDSGATPIEGLPTRRGPIDPVEFVDLPPSLKGQLESRVGRLGYLGAFFAFTGRQPAALAGFHAMSEELKLAVPFEIAEVIALASAATLASDYERTQHERLAANHDKSPAWIYEALNGGTRQELTRSEAATRALTVSMIQGRGVGVEAELRAVVELLGQDMSVGVLLLIGRCVTHGHISNALKLTPPSPRADLGTEQTSEA